MIKVQVRGIETEIQPFGVQTCPTKEGEAL